MSPVKFCPCQIQITRRRAAGTPGDFRMGPSLSYSTSQTGWVSLGVCLDTGKCSVKRSDIRQNAVSTLISCFALDLATNAPSGRKPCPHNQLDVIIDPHATVAELADAQDLGFTSPCALRASRPLKCSVFVGFWLTTPGSCTPKHGRSLGAWVQFGYSHYSAEVSSSTASRTPSETD